MQISCRVMGTYRLSGFSRPQMNQKDVSRLALVAGHRNHLSVGLTCSRRQHQRRGSTTTATATTTATTATTATTTATTATTATTTTATTTTTTTTTATTTTAQRWRRQIDELNHDQGRDGTRCSPCVARWATFRHFNHKRSDTWDTPFNSVNDDTVERKLGHLFHLIREA